MNKTEIAQSEHDAEGVLFALNEGAESGHAEDQQDNAKALFDKRRPGRSSNLWRRGSRLKK